MRSARRTICAAAAFAGIAAAIAPALVAQPAGQPDVEREARWRAEIEPGLVVGDAVDIPLAGSKPFLGIYTAATGAARAADTTAVVLVHGTGVHPDWGIVGAMRMALADRGFTTLSIQMPVRASNAAPEEYTPLLPLGADRIAAAAAWLRERGHRDLALVSHSLGSRMADAYFARDDSPFRAWASLGIVGGDYSKATVARPKPALLDVYGEKDFEAVVRDAPKRAASIRAKPGARQVRIAGADHFFAGREAQLADELAAFLKGAGR